MNNFTKKYMDDKLSISTIERQNVLNNRFAVEAIQKANHDLLMEEERRLFYVAILLFLKFPFQHFF